MHIWCWGRLIDVCDLYSIYTLSTPLCFALPFTACLILSITSCSLPFVQARYLTTQSSVAPYRYRRRAVIVILLDMYNKKEWLIVGYAKWEIIPHFDRPSFRMSNSNWNAQQLWMLLKDDRQF